MLQFLLEAILVTLAGGVVGIIMGAILSLVVYFVDFVSAVLIVGFLELKARFERGGDVLYIISFFHTFIPTQWCQAACS